MHIGRCTCAVHMYNTCNNIINILYTVMYMLCTIQKIYHRRYIRYTSTRHLSQVKYLRTTLISQPKQIIYTHDVVFTEFTGSSLHMYTWYTYIIFRLLFFFLLTSHRLNFPPRHRPDQHHHYLRL